MCSFLLGDYRVDRQTDLLAPQLEACGGERRVEGRGVNGRRSKGRQELRIDNLVFEASVIRRSSVKLFKGGDIIDQVGPSITKRQETGDIKRLVPAYLTHAWRYDITPLNPLRLPRL